LGIASPWISTSSAAGSSFNPQITLKALSFFDDGNLPTLPDEVRSRIVDAVATLDLDLIPALKASRRV
jgi:hypothetical protein